MKILLIGIVAMVGLTEWAEAKRGAHTPGINRHQRRQEKRIEQGIKKGQISESEAASLRSQQTNIQSMKESAKADGSVTAAERKEIRAEQRKASKDIHGARHNDEAAH